MLPDFDLGERDGREFLRLAKEQGFDGKILIVTAGVDFSHVGPDPLWRFRVFRKHDSASLLAQGIRDVMAGKVWLDQEQLQTVLTTGLGNPTRRNATIHRTGAERAVLRIRGARE